MSFKIVLKEVNIEEVKKPGGRGYQVANVVYENNGQTKTQKIMSFANRDVYAAVQQFKAGQTLEVETTKNGDFTNWSKITAVVSEEAAPAAKSGTVARSTYETADERAARQVLIVKQSAIAQAVASIGAGAPLEDYLARAQVFVDWVFEKPDLWDQPNDELGGDAA